MAEPYRVTFVCTGNICRSPMAEVVFRTYVERAGLAEVVEVDSFGLGDWHVGGPADPRAVQMLQTRQYDGSAHVARQFKADRFDDYDLVIALDSGHLRALRAAAGTPERRDRVRLLREFDPDADGTDVEDPYTGGESHFAEVLEQVEAASAGLVEHVRAELERRGSTTS